jgi:hypothetical protein
VKAYSERRYDGNLADLVLSYGFKEPVKREKLWALRNFWRPRQASPGRLKQLFELAGRQGMLSARAKSPVFIDTARIPSDFLAGFAERDCSTLACDACGYCGTIAEAAVSVEPGYREEIQARSAGARSAMATGELWDV